MSGITFVSLDQFWMDHLASHLLNLRSVTRPEQVMEKTLRKLRLDEITKTRTLKEGDVYRYWIGVLQGLDGHAYAAFDYAPGDVLIGVLSVTRELREEITVTRSPGMSSNKLTKLGKRMIRQALTCLDVNDHEYDISEMSADYFDLELDQDPVQVIDMPFGTTTVLIH